MAKSLRSKKMRKNRTLLRKTVSEPIAIQRQKKLAENLDKVIKERDGSTIIGLKAVFGVKDTSNEDKTAAKSDMEVDVVEEVVKEKVSVNEKFKARKGSKSKNNPSKVLVWF
jgi:hypothetical protein